MAKRSEVCKGCCPSGGALFDVVTVYDEGDKPFRRVKQCRNCGEQKEFRKESAKVKAKRDEAAAKLDSFLEWLNEQTQPNQCGQ